VLPIKIGSLPNIYHGGQCIPIFHTTCMPLFQI
jgi:hypothetical protein